MAIRVERRVSGDYFEKMSGDYFEKMNGMVFKDGFLYKTVSVKSVSSQSVEPTFHEIQKFRDDVASLYANQKKGKFMKGDRVRVVKGDLKGLVEKVEDGIVHVKTSAPGLPETLAVSEMEVVKWFDQGDRVKAVSGAHEGVTGTVLKVEGRLVDLVADVSKEVVRVFSCNLVTCSESEMSPSITTIGASGRGGKKHPLIGRVIKIGVGPFKGYRGRVVDVNGKSARVELESQMKIVTVDCSQIISDKVHVDCDTHRGSETPMRDPGAS